MKYLQEDLSINKKEKVLQRTMTTKETMIVPKNPQRSPSDNNLSARRGANTDRANIFHKVYGFLGGERTGERRNSYHLKSPVKDAVKGNLSERIPRRNESTLILDEKVYGDGQLSIYYGRFG